MGSSNRAAYSNTPFLDWYLQQTHTYAIAHGTRGIDYLDLQFDPQANSVSLYQLCDPSLNAVRLRSTRALWDPAYADESWIASTTDRPQVRLLPRMHGWVNYNYSGTKTALGEYNWGALDNANGALTRADVLGIFRRKSLDLAALWDPPTSAQPGAFAFRMYRNYDGAGKVFGDLSVRGTSTVTDLLTIQAAQRSSDNALTLIVINKTITALATTFALAGFQPGSSAQVYRNSAANLNAIMQQPIQAVTASGFTASHPASYITLLVIPSTLAPQNYLPLMIC